MKESPKIEQQEKLNPREILLKLEKDGKYIFHGSPKKIDEFIPIQAKNKNPETSCRQKRR